MRLPGARWYGEQNRDDEKGLLQMVIYTVLPPEQVMGQEGEPPQYFTVDMGGRAFVMELVGGQARIVRLLSVDPRDYLRPEWQPGRMVGFTIPGTELPSRPSNPPCLPT